jgi:hypothetical protein
VFDEHVFPLAKLPVTTTEPPPMHSSSIASDQFDDAAYSSVLLSNHGAGTGRGARLELLDDIPVQPAAQPVESVVYEHARRQPLVFPVEPVASPAELAAPSPPLSSPVQPATGSVKPAGHHVPEAPSRHLGRPPRPARPRRPACPRPPLPCRPDGTELLCHLCALRRPRRPLACRRPSGGQRPHRPASRQLGLHRHHRRCPAVVVLARQMLQGVA